MVQNLDITRYSNNETTTMKVILKYRNHPRIVAIRIQCKNWASFSFNNVDKKDVEHLILN